MAPMVKEEGCVLHGFLPSTVDCKLCTDDELVQNSHSRGHKLSEHVVDCAV